MEWFLYLHDNVLVMFKSISVRSSWLKRSGFVNQHGVTLLETLIALAILGIVAVALLSGLATGVKATSITEERAIAESLLRSQIEYVESLSYVSYPGQYLINPGLTIPASWELSSPTTSLVHATDDGLQKVAFSAIHNGNTILTIFIYKVNRGS